METGALRRSGIEAIGDVPWASYVTKPIDFEQFMKITRSIEEFWLTIVRLPPK